LQACSGKLEAPNLPPGHTWSGDKVQRLAGQGDIYVRPTYPFSAQPPEVFYCALYKSVFLFKISLVY